MTFTTSMNDHDQDFQRSERNRSESSRPMGRRRPSSGILTKAMPTSQPLTRLSSFFTLLCLLSFFVTPVAPAFLAFDNCLSASIKSSNPRQLQWVPFYVNVNFNPQRMLNVTVYGNVTGQATAGTYPPATSPDWTNPDITFGKIVNFSQSDTNPNFTTLFSQYNLLSYTPYDAPPQAFWQTTINASVPVAPAFFANASNPYSLPAFSVAHRFNSSYAFTTLTSSIRIASGDASATALACILTNITPALSNTISIVLTYLPAIILILVAIATVLAATMSPWGSSDPLRWTSNYGRDEDLLRLVTPGFGDCLQYIQFIVLAGSLSLQYPGFFQPAVSKVGWSALMFNESFVSHGPGTQSLVDGVYVTNGTYGLTRMSQLIGMTATRDLWACMVVWLAVIIGIVTLLCQLGFLTRWVLRQLTNRAEEDLRRKNWPFTGGNVVRVVCVYFLLPIISLSFFQLVVAPRSPGVVTAFAVILLVAIFAFGAWILRLIFNTKPRSHLFDDLPTVLLYGPLYNTYSDEAAPFALVPALLTVVRGIAIGAVQPSGVAQLIMLAICEVILILTLHAFRPFHSPTSMNAYHTFFAAVRLIVILLSVAFVPSLAVAESSKGWIGYVILLLHAIVLVFGFFLNAIQTMLEVAARLLGAGGEEGTGAATRGGLVKVFGMRQLSRRARRPGFRDSMHSDAAILADDSDLKSGLGLNRTRSASANSVILLNRRPASHHASGEFDPTLICDVEPETPGEEGSFSFLPAAGTAYTGAHNKRPDLYLRTGESNDPYYRRPRRGTGELTTPGAKSRASWIGGDWTTGKHDESPMSPDHLMDKRDSYGRPLSTSPVQITAGPVPLRREESDMSLNDPRRPNVDYAVRESDFYYGVRGPALSNQPTRKLKTGPADPVGPVSSAQGWFKGMLGRKNKESGKAFEVVRSSRAPSRAVLDAGPAPRDDVYSSGVLGPMDPTNQAPRTRSALEPRRRESKVDGQHAMPAQTFYDNSPPSPINSEDEEAFQSDATTALPRVSDVDGTGRPDSSSSFGLSPRTVAPRSALLFHRPSRGELPLGNDDPSLPRKSSRRQPSVEDKFAGVAGRIPPTVSASFDGNRSTPPQGRMPFSAPLSPVESNPRMSVTAESINWQDVDAEEEIDRHSAGPALYADRRTLAAPPSVGLDRPTSMGFVNQYRASDSIHPGQYHASAHAGSAAEVVDSSWSRQNGSITSQSDLRSTPHF